MFCLHAGKSCHARAEPEPANTAWSHFVWTLYQHATPAPKPTGSWSQTVLQVCYTVLSPLASTSELWGLPLMYTSVSLNVFNCLLQSHIRLFCAC